MFFWGLQRLHPDQVPRLHLTLRWPLCRQALQESSVPHHRASHKLAHDERPQQRKEADGCPHRRPRFRDRACSLKGKKPLLKEKLTGFLDPHHDRPEPHPGRRGCHC